MTAAVRALALGLTACLGAVGLAASGARAASTVQVDTSVLDDLGPSRGDATPVVLTPPAEATAPTPAEVKPAAGPESEELPPAPVAEPAAVASSEAKPAAAAPAKRAATADAGHSIVFAKGSAELPGGADRVLEPLVRALAADPKALLDVDAYAAGGEAGKESARRLALSRGLAVRRYLESHGIEGARAAIDARDADTEGGPADRVDLAIAKN